MDTKIDPQLSEGSPLRGQAAIANAKLAYDEFMKTFVGRRWENLKVKGARVQRPLWASTSTKNPAYPDTMYVDNLIGPETVNTIPPATLDAFRDHGVARNDFDDAILIRRMKRLPNLRLREFQWMHVTQELEDEGVKAFADAFAQLLTTIDERRKDAASALGPLSASVSKRISQLQADSVPARLWDHDPTLWTKDPVGQAEVKIRMGWMDLPDKARQRLKEYQAFAKEIREEKIDRVLILGMGGSSLTAEVFSSLLAAANVDASLVSGNSGFD